MSCDNGMNITNTIGSAELAAIAAAISHDYAELTKYENKSSSQDYRTMIKAHAGIVGNERADQIAKYAARNPEAADHCRCWVCKVRRKFPSPLHLQHPPNKRPWSMLKLEQTITDTTRTWTENIRD
eukprot:scaffold22287_cov19-Tisochrysis_lutea.AAC.1